MWEQVEDQEEGREERSPREVSQVSIKRMGKRKEMKKSFTCPKCQQPVLESTTYPGGTMYVHRMWVEESWGPGATVATESCFQSCKEMGLKLIPKETGS